MKKILSMTLVLLLLITSAPFTSFAISDAGITMETISSDYATAILLDRTPGSSINLSLSPAVGSATISGDNVAMTGLTPNTDYTLTVNETVTTSVEKEYSLERRWVSTGLFSGYYYYFYKDDQNVEHEANLANVYYYLWGTKTAAQNVNTFWNFVNYFILGNSTTTSTSTGSKSFTTWPTLTVNYVGSGTVTPSRPAPYAKDSTVTLTAVPSENWHFVSWSDDASTSLTHDVVMTANQTITATFELNKHDVTFVNLGETVLNTQVNHGSLVTTQTVSPREGFVFDGWYNGENKFDFNTPITSPLTLTAKWLPVNMYFTVDNGLEVYHNGTLLTPVFTPDLTGKYQWQGIKQYYADLKTGDIIAVKGTDEGVVAGFIGEIRLDGTTYTTDSNSFWRQSEVEQTGWNTKNFNMNETWGPVVNKTYASWDGKLIGTPSGFSANWVWSANNNFSETQNHVVYFRYVVGGYPTVTFDSNGGTEVDSITVPAGTSLTGNSITLPAPTKTGFNFTKWVLVETTTEFNAATIINHDLQVVAQYTPIVPATTETPQGTTEAPATTEAPTQEQPTTQPATQPTTETITEEEVAGGFNFDSFLGGTATEETTEAVEVVDITDEANALGGATTLPQTGQLPVELFYGVGGLITAAGVFLKKKN